MYVSVFDRPFASLAPEVVALLSRFLVCGFARVVFDYIRRGFGYPPPTGRTANAVDTFISTMANMSTLDPSLTVGYVIFLLRSSWGDVGIVSTMTRRIRAIDAHERMANSVESSLREVRLDAQCVDRHKGDSGSREWMPNECTFEIMYARFEMLMVYGCIPYTCTHGSRPSMCYNSLSQEVQEILHRYKFDTESEDESLRVNGVVCIMEYACPAPWFSEWAELVRNLALSDPCENVRAAAAAKHAEYVEFCTDDEQVAY